MELPLISICIPAYKRVNYLKRLLDSILMQRFTDFEVVLSDDSPDNSVAELISQYTDRLNIRYYKNSPSLGTPANWNFAIAQAKGEWIKLMHDDDWFTDASALEKFAEATQQKCKFIFSAYINAFEETQRQQQIFTGAVRKKALLKSPMSLLANNVIGPPSVTLLHRSVTEQYDERMKWRVDLDFYIRILQQEKDYVYIREPLVFVGMSESQVTNSCIDIPQVELPEGYLLLQKYGVQHLKSLVVYDAWWRILRNTGIRSVNELRTYVPNEWPQIIYAMVQLQQKLPAQLLQKGWFSKIIMCFSYCINRTKSLI